MKLNKKDNIRLLKDCCTVREIECELNGQKSVGEKYSELKDFISNSENISFEKLHENFDDSNSIKEFLNNIEKSYKFKINYSFYNRAVQAAKKTYSFDDNLPRI